MEIDPTAIDNSPNFQRTLADGIVVLVVATTQVYAIYQNQAKAYLSCTRTGNDGITTKI
jgi:hypothetical protein